MDGKEVVKRDEGFIRKLRSDKYSVSSEGDIASTEALPDETSNLAFTNPSPESSKAAKDLADLMQRNKAKDLYINSTSLEEDDLENQADFLKLFFREFESRDMRIGFILPKDLRTPRYKKPSHVNYDLAQNIIRQTTHFAGRGFVNYLTSPAFIGFMKTAGTQQDFAQNAVNHFQNESSGNIFVYDSEAREMARILEANPQSPVKIIATSVGEVQAGFFNLESCNKMIADITGKPVDKSSETPSPSTVLAGSPTNLSSPSSLNVNTSGKGCCIIL